MNRQRLLWGLLIVIGLVDALVNLWVYLLQRQTMPLLQAAVGVLIMIAGIVRLRRELQNPT